MINNNTTTTQRLKKQYFSLSFQVYRHWRDRADSQRTSEVIVSKSLEALQFSDSKPGTEVQVPLWPQLEEVKLYKTALNLHRLVAVLKMFLK